MRLLIVSLLALIIACAPVGYYRVEQKKEPKKANDLGGRDCYFYYDKNKDNKPSKRKCQKCWCIDTSDIRRRLHL